MQRGWIVFSFNWLFVHFSPCSLTWRNKHQMARKSTSPFVPGVGGTHASKVTQSLTSTNSNLSGWVHLAFIKLAMFFSTESINFTLCLFPVCLSIHSGRALNAPNPVAPTFTQTYQRQMTPLTTVPATIPHAVAQVPHQPAYRAPTDRIFYLAHTCQPACLKRVRPATTSMHRGKNPLLTPLLYDFRRMTGRRKVNRKVIRNINMIDDFKMYFFFFCIYR